MKILIDGFFFQLARSGIARVWEDLISHWSDISPDVQFFFLNRGQDDVSLAGAETINFPPMDIEECFRVWSLEPWYQDRDKIDEICKNLNIDIFMSTYYTYSTCVKNIMYIHDCIPEVFPDIYNNEEPIWKLKSEGIYHSHGYVCVSENSARDLLKFYSVKGRPIVVAHNGVADVFFQDIERKSSKAVKKLGLNKPYVMIPGLGAADSYKNQKNAIAALAPLINNGSIELVCTGGSAQHHLDEYSDVVDVSNIKTGHYSFDDLLTLYANAVAVLYPSRYEGFGLPIVESLASGTPVITCDNSSLREVGGDMAYYVDPDDIEDMHNIIKNLLDSELSGFSEAAKARARRFNWSDTARKVDGFVRQMVLEGKHGSWMKTNGF
ncbi:MAG: glycosyltransferase family 4 protein [Colwellia sp.]|nr:glycosyltransferase family 4 protein [Colwellia sp.]